MVTVVVAVVTFVFMFLLICVALKFKKVLVQKESVAHSRSTDGGRWCSQNRTWRHKTKYNGLTQTG